VSAVLQSVEREGDVLRAPDFESDEFEAELAGRDLDLACLQIARGIRDDHDRQTAETGHDLAQHFYSFARKIGKLIGEAGDVAAGSRQTRDQAKANRVRGHWEDDRYD